MAWKPHLTFILHILKQGWGQTGFWPCVAKGEVRFEIWFIPPPFHILWSKVLISSAQQRSPSPQSKWNETFSNIFYLIWISNTQNKEGTYYRDSFLKFKLFEAEKKYTSTCKSVDKTKWKQMIAFQVLTRALSNTNWIRNCFCPTAGAQSIPLWTKLGRVWKVRVIMRIRTLPLGYKLQTHKKLYI